MLVLQMTVEKVRHYSVRSGLGLVLGLGLGWRRQGQKVIDVGYADDGAHHL